MKFCKNEECYFTVQTEGNTEGKQMSDRLEKECICIYISVN